MLSLIPEGPLVVKYWNIFSLAHTHMLTNMCEHTNKYCSVVQAINTYSKVLKSCLNFASLPLGPKALSPSDKNFLTLQGYFKNTVNI